MRIPLFFIWAGFLVILIVFRYYDFIFSQTHVPGIVSLEFASASKGQAILDAWHNHGLLRVASSLIWLDFVFIFFYVALLLTLSNRQIRKEPSIVFNALLRANFFFAVLAGLLDIIENGFLLFDIYNWNSSLYISSWPVTSLKFILAGWCLLIWMLSFVRSVIK